MPPDHGATAVRQAIPDANSKPMFLRVVPEEGMFRPRDSAPRAKELPSLTSHSNWSLRTEGSVAGKRNFQVRDKEAETALEIQGRRWGDKTYSQNPADSGLIAGFGEISVRTRMRAGRTRTYKQEIMGLPFSRRFKR